MKRKAIVVAIASLSALASTAFAESFPDRARVVAAHPVYERIPVTREECWNDRQRGYEERRVTRTDTGAPIGAGTVLGAIVGGVAGHQVGSGRGRDAATVGGAIVGGLIGNQMERDGSGERVTEVERVPVERNVQRCRTVDEVREATVGYDVRYEYNGRQFVTRMPRDPGRFVRVHVELQPVVEEAVAPPPPPGPGPRPPSYR
ncbi:MAG TPA: glycine zipper 2TM domain-containing protein [Usitatibacter sp.]|nr:glycine zipper 2TM domain-containing protein [Usitatibacter sp.]